MFRPCSLFSWKHIVTYKSYCRIGGKSEQCLRVIVIGPQTVNPKHQIVARRPR